MTPEEKLAAIKSALGRVGNGESKSAIYDDFETSEIRETIAFQLANVPTLKNRIRYKTSSWFFGFAFIVSVAARAILFSEPSLIRFGMYAALTLFAMYLMTRHLRSGYHMVVVFSAINLITSIRDYEHLTSIQSPVIVNVFFAFLVVIILLGLFLQRKLYPKSQLFGVLKGEDGKPVFED